MRSQIECRVELAVEMEHVRWAPWSLLIYKIKFTFYCYSIIRNFVHLFISFVEAATFWKMKWEKMFRVNSRRKGAAGGYLYSISDKFNTLRILQIRRWLSGVYGKNTHSDECFVLFCWLYKNPIKIGANRWCGGMTCDFAWNAYSTFEIHPVRGNIPNHSFNLIKSTDPILATIKFMNAQIYVSLETS